MAQPFFQLGVIVSTKMLVPARVIVGRGRYKKVALPQGKHRVNGIDQDPEYWGFAESNGITYRIYAIEHQNPMYGKRISIWQNDLAEAVYGRQDEEF